MKYLSSFLLPVLLLAAFSCTTQNPAFNRENIKAVWMMDQYEREDIPLDQRMVYAFDPEGGLVMTGIVNMGDGNYKWASSVKLNYEVFCCSLDIDGTVQGFYDIPASVKINQSHEIVSHRDSVIRFRPMVYQMNGEDVVPPAEEISMSKLPPRYEKADSLYGMWEYEGSSFTPFRIKFASNNALSFYVPDGTGLDWIPVSQKDYYNKYDDFLAITAFGNPIFGASEKWKVSLFEIITATKARLVLLYGQNELHFKKTETDNG